MRILLGNTSAPPTIGGVENSLRFIGRELRRRGHDVKIMCLKRPPDASSRAEVEGIEVLRVPCEVRRWPQTRLRETLKAIERGAPAILEEFRPNVIWSRSVPVSLGIRRAGYRGELVHIFSTSARMDCRGLYFHTKGLPLRRRAMLLGLWPLHYAVAARYERDLLRTCTPVTFSENMRKQLLRNVRENDVRCHVIPPGVEIEFFSRENGERYFDRIWKEYDLKPHDNVVLYVGRLSCAKNIPMLMDAFGRLKQPAKLVLVGNGSERARLEAHAQALGFAESVLFSGPQAEMLPGFYALSRVCVLPTTIESFGQVYLESMASGTPAVGFAGDGEHVLTATTEIITDAETGGVVWETSANALAAKIDSVLALDSVTYAAMSQRARDHVTQRFSWARFVEKTLALSGPHAANGQLGQE